jgi:hypothetical protein
MYYYIYQSFLLQPPIKISQLAPHPAPGNYLSNFMEPKPKIPPRQPTLRASSGGDEERVKLP